MEEKHATASNDNHNKLQKEMLEILWLLVK